MLRKLFQVRVHVQPVMKGTGLFGWQVVQKNTIQAFTSDWRAYGLRVALFNFCVLMGWKEPAKGE